MPSRYHPLCIYPRISRSQKSNLMFSAFDHRLATTLSYTPRVTLLRITYKTQFLELRIRNKIMKRVLALSQLRPDLGIGNLSLGWSMRVRFLFLTASLTKVTLISKMGKGIIFYLKAFSASFLQCKDELRGIPKQRAWHE